MSKLFFFIALFFTIQTNAQDVYVSNLIGNDLPPGNGTPSQPYKTIKKGISVCPVGRSVFVDPGTYSGLGNINNIINQSLTLTKWPFRTGEVIIDATVSGTTDTSFIVVNGASNVTIANIKMQNLIRNGSNGILIKNAGDTVKILNCFLQRIGWTNNLTTLPSATHAVNVIRVINSTASLRKNIIIKNDTVYNCATGRGEAITLSGNISGFTIDSNLVDSVSNIGIDAAGNYPDVNGYRVRNGIISNNEVHHCMSGIAASAGIYLDGSDSCIVERNKLHHNGVGISVGAEQFHSAALPPKGHIIRNNLIYSNSVGGMFIGDTVGRFINNISVFDNDFFKNRTGEAINGITSIGGSNLADTTNGPANIYGGEIALQNSDGLIMKNNIFYRRDYRRVWYVRPNQMIRNFVSDNNDYYQDAFTFVPIISIDSAFFNTTVITQQGYGNLSQFKAAWSLLEINAKEVNPLFIDTLTRDFRLKKTSPIINKGDFPSSSQPNIVGVLDFYGNRRLVCDTIDIGAHEVDSVTSIITQPINAAVCDGSNTSFTIAATGINITYQWQVNTGSGFVNITSGAPYSGVTTAALTITGVTAVMNNNQYRCVVSSTCTAAVNSNVATLTVGAVAIVTAQPTSTSACAGANTSFSITAANATAYQWQINTGSGFVNITSGAPYGGITTATLTITGITASMNNNQYRCVISNTCTTPGVNSNAATLTIGVAATVTAHPINGSACVGANANFAITAANATAYQWQVNTGSGFVNITSGAPYGGVTTATLTITSVTASMNNNQYRCVVSNTCTTPGVNSNAATLTIGAAVTVTAHPINRSACVGANANFAITAANTTAYQWQVNTGSGFVNITSGAPYSGETTATLTITGVTATMNNNQYRCVVSNNCTAGVNSNAATLTIGAVAIVTVQPTSTSACAGANASFTIIAANATAYQWQVNTGSGFVNITSGVPYSGVTTATLTITGVNASINNNQYRCVVSNTCTAGVNSNAAVLTVNSGTIVITSSPQDSKICEKEKTSFTVAANGSGFIYQWQVNTSGCSGIWQSVANGSIYSGVNTATLTLSSVVYAMNGYGYRCVVSGGCASATTISNCARLIVTELPTVSITASHTQIYPGLITKLSAFAIPSTVNYAWYKNDTLITGQTNSFLMVNVNGLGNYSTTVADANGCTAKSNSLKISDTCKDKFFVYPNPVFDKFYIRYFACNGDKSNNIIMYDAKGSRVFYRKGILFDYQHTKEEISISGLPKGCYWIVIRDSAGKIIDKGFTIIKY